MALVAPVQRARTLALGLLRRLSRCQDPTGNLHDPLTGQALSPEHYAVSLFAGACAHSGEPDLQEPAERAVRFVLQLPPRVRGAHELNNLGLLAVCRAWRCHPRGGPRSSLEAYLAQMPFASLRGHTTNNWHAMRAACLLQRGVVLGRPGDVQAARRCLHQEVLPLQDAAGLFADYPPRGVPGTRCTPLTYHAKFCAMLAMFVADLPDRAATAALRAGVLALARLCGPDGETLYFGRSCNSLYGYAAALHALRWALHLGVVEGEDAAEVAEAATRVGGFLGGLVRPDGSFRTYPTHFERERLGWDDYVDRLDYAAFAAFLLVQTPEVGELAGGPRPVRWEAPEAGLWVEGEGGTFAAFSTRGQFHPGSYLFTDARTCGLQVLTWKHRGQTVVPPPPHEAAAPPEPRWVGFMPVVEGPEGAWAVRRYEQVGTFPSAHGVAMVGRGVPVCLRRTPSHQMARRAEGRGWLQLALRGVRLAARRLGLRPPAYRVKRLRRTEVRRGLVWFRREGVLFCVDRLGGGGEAWATVRLAVPPVPDQGTLRFHRGSLRGELRLLCGAAGAPQVEEAFTSNGLAYVVRYRLRPGVAAVAAVALEDAEASCQVTPEGVELRAGGRVALVDLERLVVRW